jgi:uncharacterized membrane protein (UPF0127 family)
VRYLDRWLCGVFHDGGPYFTAQSLKRAVDAIRTEATRFRGLPRRGVLGFTVPVAATRRSRLLGLALLTRERAGEGLLIPRCSGVHTIGMRFRLDLIFLAVDGKVLALRRAVPPGRIIRCRGAVAVLELPTPG